MYTQVMYCLDRVPAVVKAKPELANVEPFKTVMSGDRAAMAKLSEADWIRFSLRRRPACRSRLQRRSEEMARQAKDPRWKRPYTELTYLPMKEV